MTMSNSDHNGDSSVGHTGNNNVTLRMIIAGREVGVIIGRGGETINSIRSNSNCKIHISDGSVPERVITVVGQSENVYEAYSAMCDRLEAGEDGKSKQDRKETLTLRMVVPASQCGSLIGKGGAKIKEIRDLSGANVNVASDHLPGSTERCVTVSGNKDAVSQCIYHMVQVLAETPVRVNTVQYQPGRSGIPFPPGMRGPAPGPDGRHMAHGPPTGGPLLAGAGPGGSHALAALASLASSQISRDSRRGDRDRDREVSQQMSVSNDMIGAIIGKGGSKIAEIRQMSGANIQISKGTDKEASTERQIQITGYPDAVALAKSLINMSLDLHKMEKEQMDEEENGDDGQGERRKDDRRHRRNDYNNYGAGGMGPEGVLANREVMQALNTLAHYNNITNGGLFGGAPGAPAFGQMSGMNRGGGGGRVFPAGSMMGGNRAREDDRKPNARNKFSPY